MMGKISGQMQMLLIDINELVPENHLWKQTGKKKRHQTRMRRMPLIGAGLKSQADGEGTGTSL